MECDKRDVRGKHGSDLPTEMIVSLDNLGRDNKLQKFNKFHGIADAVLIWHSHWLNLCLYLKVHNPNSPEFSSYVTGLVIKCISRSALQSHEKKKSPSLSNQRKRGNLFRLRDNELRLI